MGYKYVADMNQLAFRFESGTYATASGSHYWIGLVQDHTPSEDAGINPIRYQGTANRNISLFTDGPINLNGTFSFYPQDFRFLMFALGSCHDVSGTSAAHYIREANSDHANYAIPTQVLDSITLVDSKKTATAGSNFIRTFRGCMVDSFAMTLSEGEIANTEITYRAKDVVFSSGAVTAVTQSTKRPIMWSDVNVHIPSGLPLTNCTDFSLTINNNIEARFPLNNSRFIEEGIPLNRDYEVSATFIMDATNAKRLYDQYFLGGSTFNSMIAIKSPQAGSAFIVLSGCRFTDMEVPSPVEGLHEQTGTIMATSMTVDVFDDVASYKAF